MTKSKRQSNRPLINRIDVIGGLFFLLALGIIWRLFDLQVLKGPIKQAEAQYMRLVTQELDANRGEIYTIVSIHDQNSLQPLAVNQQRYEIYANPSQILDPAESARLIAETLALEIEGLIDKLSRKNDPYEPIIREADEEQMNEVEGLGLPGIYHRPAVVRYYPMTEIFGQITGFLGYGGDKRVGQYGLEGYLENLLAGSGGFLESELDPTGRLIALGDRQLIPAVDGADFILTFDQNIQQRGCDLIAQTREKYSARAGTIIVMEPATGAIRAMCSVPGFDPNNYGQVEDINIFSNPAVSAEYEPGSIFKAITMAAALDSGSVTADTTFIDTGSVVIGEHTIKNANNQVYDKSTMSEVLENSINTGSVFAALQTGLENFRQYLDAFGFGQSTGIEFPAELSGDISALNKPGDIYLATSAFGQGLTVTPIQMIRAFATIANHGRLIKPRVLSKIILPDKQEIMIDPETGQQVISSQTAAILSAMLVNVIEKGQAQTAQVPGFYLAGKTGTAQVAGSGGYSDQTIHSFVGFGPISEPKFVILIKLDSPQWGDYSANTVAPVFADMAKFLLQYYQVQPER